MLTLCVKEHFFFFSETVARFLIWNNLKCIKSAGAPPNDHQTKIRPFFAFRKFISLHIWQMILNTLIYLLFSFAQKILIPWWPEFWVSQGDVECKMFEPELLVLSSLQICFSAHFPSPGWFYSVMKASNPNLLSRVHILLNVHFVPSS